ncbi:MAG: 16S rRNA (guanine(966)-N(2))-methyltransferase RsmD [Candidatus Caldatribacteriota bacterium]|nr:16S rRNA (guanine(966)-N(2))-methyltransferase RsmD [Candidatus Caldatribacteriota bacterium]
MKIVAGKNKGNKLKPLKSISIRPTSQKVREALFDIIMPGIGETIFLDIFAGTGAVGIEALSRGAKKVVFVEKELKCVKIIIENLKKTKNYQFSLILNKRCLTGLRLLSRKKYLFDYIFLDPPYNKGMVNSTITEISELRILKEDGIIIIQHHKKEIVKNNYNGLKMFRQKKYSESMLSFYKYIDN